ncbi:hypothetical protein AVEN_231409-1 [Araneus ventricosus]|uniref:Uncharacterized protein n=1 Tax=Araneus ventricosus TaxID=182803 RepID=A0A4Y2V508_ARAVE|nr:hypothetical protein AVEN_231409-1 [Araneus ventricosus]
MKEEEGGGCRHLEPSRLELRFSLTHVLNTLHSIVAMLNLRRHSEKDPLPLLTTLLNTAFCFHIRRYQNNNIITPVRKTTYLGIRSRHSDVPATTRIRHNKKRINRVTEGMKISV